MFKRMVGMGVILGQLLFGAASAFPQGPAGKITAPRDGDSVFAEIHAEGSAGNLPAGGHLWLAVRKGPLAWPKAPEISSRRGTWSATVSEGGTPPGGSLSLVLFVVNSKGQQQVAEWIRVCNAIGHCPGLPSIPGAVELDSITLKMR